MKLFRLEMWRLFTTGGKHPVLFPPELVETGMYNKQSGKLEGNS